jgi:hypothetical protein
MEPKVKIGTITFDLTSGDGNTTKWTGSCPEYQLKAGHRLVVSNSSGGWYFSDDNKFGRVSMAMLLNRP